MLHFFAVHAIILLVIACPVLCFGESAMARGDAGGATSAADRDDSPSECCGACRTSRQHESSSESEQNRSPSPQPESSHCLCKGAVAAGDADSDAPDADGAGWEWAALDAAPGPHHAARRLLSHTPRHFPPLATGRSLCALTQTLLL
jgi:hypothetical protein